MANRKKDRPKASRSVNRKEAEELQQMLFKASSQALQQAVDSGNIPAALLSSVHAILRDGGLAPDLSEEADETAAEDLHASWMNDLHDQLGL